MFSTTRTRVFKTALKTPPSATIPSFLLPAFETPPVRAFSISSAQQSQIGKAPITLPPEVSFSINEPPKPKPGQRADPDAKFSVTIEGPLGTLTYPIPRFFKLDHDAENRKVVVAVEDRTIKRQREMWGTVRAYLHNHVLGVSEGHSAILRLVGVGYRATVEDKAITKEPEFPGQQFVSLKVGYSHPIELPVPKGVKASVPQPTRILLQGAEKEVVLQFAAEIRAWRVPEPYKGKGIFVNNETIKLKAKKIK